jgi:hypothetical protein
LTQAEATAFLQKHGGASVSEAEQIYDYTGGSALLLRWGFSVLPKGTPFSAAVDSVLAEQKKLIKKKLSSLHYCLGSKTNATHLLNVISSVHYRWSPSIRCLLHTSILQFASPSLSSFVVHDRIAQKALELVLNTSLPESLSLKALVSD